MHWPLPKVLVTARPPAPVTASKLLIKRDSKPSRPPVTANPLDERRGADEELFRFYRLARISHKVPLRDRSNACPIRLRGQKDAEGILAVCRGGLREQSLMGWVVGRSQQEVCEKCGLEAYFSYVGSLSPRGEPLQVLQWLSFIVRLSLFLMILHLSVFAKATDKITVGSKMFTESYILAELAAQLFEEKGFEVDRKTGLGGTLVAYQALVSGEIDLYFEYTGTVSEVIVKKNKDDIDFLNRELGQKGLILTPLVGFDNSFAIALKKNLAIEKSVLTISDLNGVHLKAAFSQEFMNRADGWPNLQATYGLDLDVTSMDHGLAFEAIRLDQVQVIDAYSTDAKIKKFDLLILEDNLKFFPTYYAAPLMRKERWAQLRSVVDQFDGLISNEEMVQLNARVELDKLSYAEAANEFLIKKNLVTQKIKESKLDLKLLGKRVVRHLYLTFVAVFFASLVSIPLGALLLRSKYIANIVMSLVGVLQTIPSIALLAFMIPVFGVGVKPAIAGLFLYSLLPILRNVYVALDGVDSKLIESAQGIGLSQIEILMSIRFPLGLPVILAGVRIATIVNIGTATLAAFIGAGGLGEPIVTGITLNDTQMILQGAIPAALLAILFELNFEWIAKKLPQY